jgi:glycosyltransferase involved in cell wall biosynthesis
MNVSVVVAVYNKVRELDLVLAALSIQTYREFEVIVAEDGQSEEIQRLVGEWTSRVDFRITHCSHEDIGWRKNRILNEAVRRSSGEYLIFFDGDCLPHSSFVEAHVAASQSGTVLCGRRVNLGRSASQRISREVVLDGRHQRLRIADIVRSRRSDEENDSAMHAEEGVIIRNASLRKALLRKEGRILGCNFSLHKNLLEEINGFDENYTGPGFGEDSDIEFRLRLLGVAFKSVRNLAVQYHLYHRHTTVDNRNREYYEEMRMRDDPVCSAGLRMLD